MNKPHRDEQGAQQAAYLVRQKRQGEFDLFYIENEHCWYLITKKHLARRLTAEQAGKVVARILSKDPLAVLEVEHV